MSDTIKLVPLTKTDRENFIKRNQIAFNKAVIEEFGPQSEEAIPKEDIETSLDSRYAQSFNILLNEKIVGGVVVDINNTTNKNSLSLLFIDPECHSKGIGLKVWNMIEAKYPKTKVWETHTPYFETRNIHFYVNKCGFHIVEFFNPKHPDSHGPGENVPGGELFFRFEKQM